MDTSRLGLTSLNLCDKLLERYKVAAVPGIAFGNDKAIRISYCTTLDILKEALDRFEEFLQGALKNVDHHKKAFHVKRNAFLLPDFPPTATLRQGNARHASQPDCPARKGMIK